MRIGLIAARYPPEFEGGSERVVSALARGLVARGHALKLVAGSDRPASERTSARERVDGVEVLRVRLAAEEPIDLELDRPRVEALVAEELADCEIVHLHHWSTLSQRLVRTLSATRPVLVTLHDLFATCPRFFRSSPQGLRCPPQGVFDTCARCIANEAPGLKVEELERRLRLRADEFAAELDAAALWISPSASHARRLELLLPLDPRRKTVLAPGLTRELARMPRVERPAGAALRLLHFGNLCDEKGSFDLVETLAHLPPEDFELTLAGRALAPGLEARIEQLRGRTRVRLLGAFDARSLAAACAQADLALFPSRAEESYGLVLDEAHALGLPAWTSDRGALSERLVEGERCLPARDPAAWAAALAELSRDPDSLVPLAAKIAALSVPGPQDSALAHEALYLRTLSERAA